MRKPYHANIASQRGSWSSVMLEKVGLFERSQWWSSGNVPWISEILVRLTESWKSMPSLFRSAFVVAFHAILVVVSHMFAFWLRFDGDIHHVESWFSLPRCSPGLWGFGCCCLSLFGFMKGCGGTLVSGISETLSVV